MSQFERTKPQKWLSRATNWQTNSRNMPRYSGECYAGDGDDGEINNPASAENPDHRPIAGISDESPESGGGSPDRPG